MISEASITQLKPTLKPFTITKRTKKEEKPSKQGHIQEREVRGFEPTPKRSSDS